MPWEETDQYIRSGHCSPEDFQPGNLRTVTISEEEGIKAIIGKPKGEDKTTVQSYLFDKAKGWDLEKAKAWFEQHREGLVKVKEHFSAVLPFQVLEKIVDKPLRIRGIAMAAGMSRNLNIYTPEELQVFADKLVSAPVYVEHVAVPNAVGKVTSANWDGQSLWYEAEIFDDETAAKIRRGLIQHVSVGADYETLDVVDGRVPHGLHNAELSLVAVPGIPETNVQVLEHLAQASSSFPHSASTSDNLGARKSEEEKMEEKEEVESAEAEKRTTTTPMLAASKDIAEAEWDTEYINNLPDDAFAYIEPGGEKDEQGKTVPRSLRHLPYKNAQGNLDADHVRNALARLDQTQISADAKAEAKRKLCAAAKELNIASEVCGLTEQVEALRCKLSEAEAKLAETTTNLDAANKTITDLRKQLPGGGLLENPPETMPVSEAVALLEGLLLSPMIERSTLMEQRHHQQIRREIHKLKERLKSG